MTEKVRRIGFLEFSEVGCEAFREAGRRTPPTRPRPVAHHETVT
jgi:hypothetical protein